MPRLTTTAMRPPDNIHDKRPHGWSSWFTLSPCHLVTLSCLLLAGCHKGKEEARARPERLPRIEVVRPKRTLLVRKTELAATVEPLQKVELVARVPGVVSYLPRDIDIGRRVK